MNNFQPIVRRICQHRPIPCLLLALFAVLWLSPALRAQSAGVSGTSVTVAANASDNVGVVGVRFLLNGSLIGAEDTTAPYAITWNSTTVPDGGYTLTAEARDAAGNVGTSPPVSITVTNSGGGGDTTPPTVQTTGPANGSVVANTIPVTASASDNVGVAGVQFLLDGAPLGSEDTSAPYSVSWNTAAVSNGSHTLAARARDAAGNTATSGAISVLVSNGGGGGGDTTPPSIQTTGPASGSTVSATVSITANASDNVGVAGVQFLVDGVPLGSEDTSAPFAINWDTTAVVDGPHVVAARARDAAGNQTTSGGASVVVDNSGGGDPQTSGSGNVDLSVTRTTPGYRRIHADSDAGDTLELYVDAQLVQTVQGNTLDYDWDVGGLLGQHQIQVFANEGTELVASASMAYTIESASTPTLTLDVVELPIIGATIIEARANVGTTARLELYVDGGLVVSKLGDEIDYAWDPAGTSHQILFVAYDGVGVIGSMSVLYVP